MSVEEDVIRLILETTGEEGIKKLRGEFDLTKGSSEALVESWKQGAVTTEQMTKGVTELERRASMLQRTIDGASAALARQSEVVDEDAAELERYRQKLMEMAGAQEMERRATVAQVRAANDFIAANARARAAMDAFGDMCLDAAAKAQATASATRRIGDATPGASRGTRDLGRATLEASRGLEDLQYGLAGVLNNLPNLVQSLGGPAGVAAAVSVLAVVSYQLYKHWDDLMALMGASSAGTIPRVAGSLDEMNRVVRESRERIEELGKKTHVSIAEFEEYTRVKIRLAAAEKQVADEMARQQVIKQQDESKDKAQAERAGGFNAAIAGHAGEVDKVLFEASIAATKKEAESIMKSARGIADPAQRKMFEDGANALLNNMLAEARRSTDELRAKAGAGDQKAIDKIAAAVGAAKPGAISGGIGSDIAALATGEAERQADLERQAEAKQKKFDKKKKQEEEGKKALEENRKEDLADREKAEKRVARQDQAGVQKATRKQGEIRGGERAQFDKMQRERRAQIGADLSDVEAQTGADPMTAVSLLIDITKANMIAQQGGQRLNQSQLNDLAAMKQIAKEIASRQNAQIRAYNSQGRTMLPRVLY